MAYAFAGAAVLEAAAYESDEAEALVVSSAGLEPSAEAEVLLKILEGTFRNRGSLKRGFSSSCWF